MQHFLRYMSTSLLLMSCVTPVLSSDGDRKISAERYAGADSKGDRRLSLLPSDGEGHDSAERYDEQTTQKLVQLCNNAAARCFVISVSEVPEKADELERLIEARGDINAHSDANHQRSLCSVLVAHMRYYNKNSLMPLLKGLLRRKPDLTQRDRCGKDVLVEALDPVFDHWDHYMSTKASPDLDAALVSTLLDAGARADGVYKNHRNREDHENFSGVALGFSPQSPWTIQYANESFVVLCVAMARNNPAVMSRLLDAGAPLIWRHESDSEERDICTWASMRGIPIMPLKHEIEERMRHNQDRVSCGNLLLEHLPAVLCAVIRDYCSYARVVPARVPPQLFTCTSEEQFSALTEDMRIDALKRQAEQEHSWLPGQLTQAITTNNEVSMRLLLAAGVRYDLKHLRWMLNFKQTEQTPTFAHGIMNLERLLADRKQR